MHAQSRLFSDALWGRVQENHARIGLVSLDLARGVVQPRSGSSSSDGSHVIYGIRSKTMFDKMVISMRRGYRLERNNEEEQTAGTRRGCTWHGLIGSRSSVVEESSGISTRDAVGGEQGSQTEIRARVREVARPGDRGRRDEKGLAKVEEILEEGKRPVPMQKAVVE